LANKNLDNLSSTNITRNGVKESEKVIVKRGIHIELFSREIEKMGQLARRRYNCDVNIKLCLTKVRPVGLKSAL
jgi:hypothetical protein